MPLMSEVLEWRGQTMVSVGDEKIGKIEEIYLDTETERPEWALVNTGMFGSASSFVPIADAAAADGSVQVPFEKAQVKDAPKIEGGGDLSQEDESALYAHYGLTYSESRSDSGLAANEGVTTGRTDRTTDREPVGGDVSGPATDAAITRSEEELRVGTTTRETGRARLRKYIVTEDVTTTVPVEREEVRIEREPITEANRDAATSGADLSEEEHEVVLHAEEVVVDKNVVPKERVRLDTDVTTEERQVTEGVRKEQVELLDADGEPAQGRDGVRETDEGVARR
jgi:uncharacterized protein (TIGR02271 family)